MSGLSIRNGDGFDSKSSPNQLGFGRTLDSELARHEGDHGTDFNRGDRSVAGGRQSLNSGFQILGIERDPIEGLTRRVVDDLAIELHAGTDRLGIGALVEQEIVASLSRFARGTLGGTIPVTFAVDAALDGLPYSKGQVAKVRGEELGTVGATDITAFGGWKAWLAR